MKTADEIRSGDVFTHFEDLCVPRSFDGVEIPSYSPWLVALSVREEDHFIYVHINDNKSRPFRPTDLVIVKKRKEDEEKVTQRYVIERFEGRYTTIPSWDTLPNRYHHRYQALEALETVLSAARSDISIRFRNVNNYQDAVNAIDFYEDNRKVQYRVFDTESSVVIIRKYLVSGEFKKEMEGS